MTAMAALCAALIFSTLSPASSQLTRGAAEGHSSPPANIEDLSWLAGEWAGLGISGGARESYSPPTGGTIVGHFVQTNAHGQVSFYEIVEIAPLNGSLVYRLKHFGPGLEGWEEKREVRAFPLIAREGDSWFFDGLTLIRKSSDAMTAVVRVRSGDRQPTEYIFDYRRVR